MGYVGVGFGILGIAVMVGISTRKGTMVHCTVYCPLGLLSVILGKLSPFRLRIGDSCTDCGRCSGTCRYNALRMNRIKKRKPGLNCTLCGDCLSACKDGALSYGFLRLSPKTSRHLFLVLVVSLHAVFLGVARI